MQKENNLFSVDLLDSINGLQERCMENIVGDLLTARTGKHWNKLWSLLPQSPFRQFYANSDITITGAGEWTQCRLWLSALLLYERKHFWLLKTFWGLPFDLWKHSSNDVYITVSFSYFIFQLHCISTAGRSASLSRQHLSVLYSYL